jgi:hypothetical protein
MSAGHLRVGQVASSSARRIDQAFELHRAGKVSWVHARAPPQLPKRPSAGRALKRGARVRRRCCCRPARRGCSGAGTGATRCRPAARASPSAVQLGQRAVQHLLRQATRQGFQHVFDRRRPASSLRARASSAARQSSAWRFRAWISGTLARWSSQCAEALHAGVDDGLGLRHGGLALLAGGLHQGRQVVDGVQVHVDSCDTSGSMSRGTARSTMKIGRWRRALRARSTMRPGR